jgi:hypothetical protein
MKSTSRILISLLALHCCTYSVSWGAKIHFIALFNTIETSIAPSAEKVYSASEQEFGAIANMIGYEFVPYKIKGSDFEGRTKIEQVLQNLKTEPQDIVILHAFGHGFRYTNQQSLFPVLQLSAAQTSRVGIETEELYRMIQNKPVRFKLVLVEACNKVEISQEQGKIELMAVLTMGDKGMKMANVERYKDLFLRVKGSLIIASAKKGQEARVPNPTVSAVTPFFRHFQTSMQKLLSDNKKAKWRTLVDDVNNDMQIENRITKDYLKEVIEQEPVCEFRDFVEDTELPTTQTPAPQIAYTFDTSTENYLKYMKEGNYLYGQKEYKKAQVSYQNALNIRPDDYRARQGLYSCKAMMGLTEFKELDRNTICEILGPMSQNPDFKLPQFAIAQYVYGILLIRGKGECRSNLTEAEKWLHISYNNGIESACHVWERVIRSRTPTCGNW